MAREVLITGITGQDGAYLGYELKVSFEEGMKELVEWASKIEARDGFDKAYKEAGGKMRTGYLVNLKAVWAELSICEELI